MRLLKKTITTYFIYSTILLLVSIPAFYLALKRIIVNSVDENLITAKTEIIPKLQNDVLNHRESNLISSVYDIHYEKLDPEKNEDSIYTIDSNAPDPNQLLPNRLLVSHFLVNQEIYSLHIQTSMVDQFMLIKRIILVVTLLLIGLLLGLLLINRVLTKMVWRPFYNTLSRLKQYRIDKQPVLKLEKSTISEFDDLNLAIEVLTETNYQAYLSQREFTENASHEMQSPLAVFQSKLELLMQTNPLNQEQAMLIADLASASKRMLRLNKSLILLTKIDNDQFLEKEVLFIRDILQKLIKQFDFQIHNRSIRCNFHEGEDIRIEANKTLIEIMLSNLLSNAIRHNIPNGFIQIILKDRELIIQNSGKSSPLDSKKLFKRFQKESPDADSLGLGLEMVKKICSMYQFQIKYQFDNLTHVFSVKF
jgi:signal transduction histidine kinase